MQRIQSIIGASALIFLASCSAYSGNDWLDAPRYSGEEPVCDADAYRSYIGQSLSSFDRGAYAGEVRVVRQNFAISTELREERLSILVDQGNTIRNFACM